MTSADNADTLVYCEASKPDKVYAEDTDILNMLIYTSPKVTGRCFCLPMLFQGATPQAEFVDSER